MSTVFAGMMSYELALDLVICRESLLKSSRGHEGGMAIVGLDAVSIERLIQNLNLNLVIAVYNHSESHVVSGSSAEIDIFVEYGKRNGHRIAKLDVREGTFFYDDFVPQ